MCLDLKKRLGSSFILFETSLDSIIGVWSVQKVNVVDQVGFEDCNIIDLITVNGKIAFDRSKCA
jgi:hypothetical protein